MCPSWPIVKARYSFTWAAVVRKRKAIRSSERLFPPAWLGGPDRRACRRAVLGLISKVSGLFCQSFKGGPGLENGPLRVHICRMGHNATMAVVATIIVTAAIYSLWALRSRK